MSAPITIEKYFNVDEKWVACSACDRETRHEVLVTVDRTELVDPESGYEEFDKYLTLRCQGCDTVSFCHENKSTGDEIEEANGLPGPHFRRRLYPPRVAGRKKLPGLQRMPAGVRHVYLETHAALCSDQPILAGVGIRAILEAVCKEKGAAGGTLLRKIDGLVGMGLATSEGAKILHQVRQLGNTAAHEVGAQPEEELAAAFEVVEHLLTGVYVLPARASRIASKAGGAGAKTPAQKRSK